MDQRELTITVRVDGAEYPLRLAADGDWALTGREWGVVRRMAGVRRAELLGSLVAADVETNIALAVIAMARAGQRADEDRLLDGVNLVEIEIPDLEGDAAVPPAPAGEGGAGSENGHSQATQTIPEPTGPPSSPASMESSPAT